ncbi:hypothetical protein KIN20_030671 [Parelaphostrongylus tenuis]|uniref:Uncharacterized protein n=1 Tax=Parelaphostrongylus tenuis TaxID=148309 RepID=A0AAD5R462_PARTN|nr:hypothetical protein KIN20_030671 [Parelaphostrongylus tenuis]
MTGEEVAHLLCVNFNQDAKSLAVGHANGYILYKTTDALESSIVLDDADTSPGSVLLFKFFRLSEKSV